MGPMGLLLAGLRLFSLLVLSCWGASCACGGCCFQDLPFGGPDSGSPADSALGPKDLSCYRDSSSEYRCSWSYEGPTAEVRHFLRCCMDTKRCCYFAAHQDTQVHFSEQDGVSVLSNVSLWVETWVRNQTARSSGLTLTLYNWVKYDPPAKEAIKVNWSPETETLRMEWKAPEEAQDKAHVQLQRRTPRGSWQLRKVTQLLVKSDCGPPAAASLESCSFPLDPEAAQEIQIRRRRLASSGAPGGPWSDWSQSVCVPHGTLPPPNVTFKEEPLGPEGRRRVTVLDQVKPGPGGPDSRGGGDLGSERDPLQPEPPEGCGDPDSGAQVIHQVSVHMRSCCLQPRPGPVRTGRLQCGRARRTRRRKLEFHLSGAAYDLAVFSCSRFHLGHNRTWKLPARDPAERGVLNLRAGAEGSGLASLQWAARAPGTTYCMEWQPHGQDGAPGHCERITPLDGDQAGMVKHSWAVASGDLGQEQCYKVSVFASAFPKKTTSWASVVSSYYFGGNVSAAGTPQRVWVNSLGGSAAVVSWTESKLRACPGALHRYLVRCGDDAGGVAELLVSPSETRVTLQGLRAGVVYSVQVRADSAWLPGTWSPPQRFRLETQISRVSVILASLGSFVSILFLGALGYLGLSRALWHLCPPLPTPYASTAVEFPVSQGKQIWQWGGPGDPEAYPEETLVVTSQDEADGIKALERQGATEDGEQGHQEAQGPSQETELSLLSADQGRVIPTVLTLGGPGLKRKSQHPLPQSPGQNPDRCGVRAGY
ncbi:interleukin-12 receptor subunit beta-1 [Perognathus longimembris pacificus]|uniref:interleukin-12 receptor subunit beta-1 n=1 Tax=Perognathus longimembris pacificus TaxID=214514 RepID=UPI002019150D|nr:interleukin-12 receptor subunit beta-1 [Perognathus longimembris pacificus]